MKRSKVKTGIIIGIMVLFGVVSLQAQSNREQRQKPPTFSELLEKMDANDDGKLSKKEVKGPLKNNFSKVDTDEDGFITEEEMKKAPKPKGQRPNN